VPMKRFTTTVVLNGPTCTGSRLAFRGKLKGGHRTRDLALDGRTDVGVKMHIDLIQVARKKVR
jgi:hypothetical protein